MTPHPRIRRIIAATLIAGVVAAPMALAGPNGNGGGGAANGGAANGGAANGGGNGGGRGGAVPGSVSVSGLTAGQGAVDVREYIDLATAASGQAHQRIASVLLRRVAAEGLGSISLRPLATSTDINSTEAGQAVVAGGLQNKSWEITAALVRAQGAGGDWINPAMLRRVAKRVAGLNVARFLRDAGPAAYPQLAQIRDEATSAGVTVTPAYVVHGPSGTRVVTTPGNASEVIAAIKSVR